MTKIGILLYLLWICHRQIHGTPGTSLCREEDGYHRCVQSKICIPRYKVHNYELECREGNETDGFNGRGDDKTDEFSDPLQCDDNELVCRFSQKCVPRHLINTPLSCKLNESFVFPCRNKSEFTCKHSRICIPRWLVQNGKRDCDTMVVKDGSDEEMSLALCINSEFPCSEDNTVPLQCIPREWVLDGVNDCTNGRDEVDKLTSCHNDTEFRCQTNGRCLARYRVLDGYNDCPDASDEKQALKCIPDKEFQCLDNGRCIPRSWRGNKLVNCKDGSDEVPWTDNDTCVEGEFRCNNSKRCIPTSLLCDGMDHCGDCSDEIESCNEPRMIRCLNDPGTCVHRTYSCDEYSDCPGSTEDVQQVTGFKCNKLIAGLDNRLEYCVIPQWSLTDEYPNCQDSSDLCFINGTFTCHRCLYSDIIISPKQLCDGIFDCPDLTDECLCAQNVPASAPSRYLCDNICYGVPGSSPCSYCSEGQVKCGSENLCIAKSQVCDGKVDCPITKLDELNCGRHTTQSSNRKIPDFQCNIVTSEIRTIALKFTNKDLVDSLLPVEAKKCDNIVECSVFEDECSERANCSNRLPVCDQIKIEDISIPGSLLYGQNIQTKLRKCSQLFGVVLGKSVCNGIDECEERFDETNCPKQFKCSAGKVNTVIQGFRDRISIPVNKTCDLVSDCVNSTDEVNCSTISHFYCGNKKPLFVPTTKVLDGVSDCSDSSDECPPNYLQNDALASNEQMIKLRALEILVWFMAVFALFGNLAVMVKTWLYFHRLTREKTRVKLGLINRVLIFNLAVSDLLMGIVLLVIGIKAIEFSGNYCLFDKAWRSSDLCNAIGALTVVSSETSVLTLVCITSYRLYSVFNPFNSRSVKARIVMMWICIIWLISFLIALLPLSRALSSDMITSAQITPSPYFHTGQVSLADVRQFALRIGALENKTQPQVTSYDWVDLADFLRSIHGSVAPTWDNYFGYYSSSSVCIPRLFRIRKDESNVNVMSSIVITFNFVALLYIATAYVMIYMKSRDRGLVKAKNHQIKKMQKKITVLIATDFCCWLPICIMTFMSMSGQILTPDSYAVSAIVLLPINSSLNPIIYTNLPQTIYSNVKKLIDGASLPTRKKSNSIASSVDKPHVKGNSRTTKV